MIDYKETIERLKRHVDAADEIKARSKRMQELAIMARNGKEKEAQKELRSMDRQPHVTDAGNYFEDLKNAITLLQTYREGLEAIEAGYYAFEHLQEAADYARKTLEGKE